MKFNEIAQIILVIIVLAFSASFKNLINFPFVCIFLAIIFIVNIGAKKLMAYYLQSGVETKIWNFQRFGLYERSHFKKPIPIGIILPFLIAILSLGNVTWFASTQSEITASRARVAKRHGIYRFSEMTESSMGIIVAAGIFACLILAILAYIVGFPEISKLAILFAAFNMLPLGHLDGTKIFFGSIVLWAVMAILCLIGLGYVFFLV